MRKFFTKILLHSTYFCFFWRSSSFQGFWKKMKIFTITNLRVKIDTEAREQQQQAMSSCLGHWVGVHDHFTAGGTRVQLRLSTTLQQGPCCWDLIKWILYIPKEAIPVGFGLTDRSCFSLLHGQMQGTFSPDKPHSTHGGMGKFKKPEKRQLNFFSYMFVYAGAVLQTLSCAFTPGTCFQRHWKSST